MRDYGHWSVNLGRWGGVQVRLHMFFLLFATFTLYLSWLAAQHQPNNQTNYIWIGCGSLVVLALSVLAHEWGHVWAMRRLGGAVDQMVVWPLGGLNTPELPREPQADLIVQLAGPLVNLSLAAACAPVLLLDNSANLWGLMNPLPTVDVANGAPWLIACKLVFWINWVLALVNLFPGFPLDGGRIVRAALTWRWGAEARQRATIIASLIAQAAAVGLLIVAWFLRNSDQNSIMPPWFALVLLAIFLFFSAQHERQKPLPSLESDDQPFGYDFSQGYTSLERSHEPEREDVGPITRWLEERREARQKRQQEIELEEDRKMDELLARISVQGMQSLSAEEKLLLERVSARYRQRQDHSS